MDTVSIYCRIRDININYCIQYFNSFSNEVLYFIMHIKCAAVKKQSPSSSEGCIFIINSRLLLILSPLVGTVFEDYYIYKAKIEWTNIDLVILLSMKAIFTSIY